jgi:hypothetical protein
MKGIIWPRLKIGGLLGLVFRWGGGGSLKFVKELEPQHAVRRCISSSRQAKCLRLVIVLAAYEEVGTAACVQKMNGRSPGLATEPRRPLGQEDLPADRVTEASNFRAPLEQSTVCGSNMLCKRNKIMLSPRPAPAPEAVTHFPETVSRQWGPL